MVSKLRLTKGVTNISSTLKKFIKKCSKVATNLNKIIKESWSLLFSIKKEVINEKDEGLFSALTATFQDERISVIDSGASRHMTGHHKQLETLSKGKYSYSMELGDNKRYPMRGIGSTSIELDNGSNILLA